MRSRRIGGLSVGPVLALSLAIGVGASARPASDALNTSALNAEAMAPPPAAAPAMATARSDYIEHCGGCHGLAGSSAPAKVPELRGRVGYFMCTPEGRDYLIRVPNVAHVAIPEAANLARLMNYVTQEIGAGSRPSAARDYSAEEVAALRERPLGRESLVGERARLVEKLIRSCRAPAALRDLYGRPAAAR